MADQAATTEPAGTTILATQEPITPDPAAKLFQSEGDKTNAVAAAKEAALKELEAKTAAPSTTTTATTTTATTTEPVKDPAKAATTEAKPTATDTKPADKAATTTQTEYTLNLPENSALTKEDLDATLKEAKAAGLSEDEAKEMLQSKDQVAKSAQTRLQTQQEQTLKTMVQGWRDEVKNDPELGGEHLAETAIKSSRAAKAIFDAPTLKFLNDTGYGDNPGLVRAMVKVYNLIGEDKFIRGTTGNVSSVPTTTEEKAKRLFGNPIKEAVGMPK